VRRSTTREEQPSNDARLVEALSTMLQDLDDDADEVMSQVKP
jgi:hypothetical protein